MDDADIVGELRVVSRGIWARKRLDEGNGIRNGSEVFKSRVK